MTSLSNQDRDALLEAWMTDDFEEMQPVVSELASRLVAAALSEVADAISQHAQRSAPVTGSRAQGRVTGLEQAEQIVRAAIPN